MSLADNPSRKTPGGLPFRLEDYLDVVNWTERDIKDDNIEHIPPILKN